MIDMVNFEGAKAKVRQFSFRFSAIAVLAIATLAFTACGPSTGGTTGEPRGGETAATVNGKAIKMEQVERVIKAQTQGQDNRLSPLELAQARLQVLDQLIQQEVMYQKAETEKTVPTDDKVTEELNKLKQQSGKSAEEFDKQMKDAGETEESLRESIKKNLAIQALNEKVTSKIEPPKDQEIVDFYNGNKEGFKNKRGAQLGVIVIDPRKVDANDTTTNDIEAQQKAKEVGDRLIRGADFATVARETSEDSQTRLQGGDWRYFSEEEMKQMFGGGFAEFVMTKMQNGQIIPQTIPLEGRLLIVKLQRKQEQDEDRTLETPGVRQQITDLLINSRKQLLSQAYMAMAMDGAKVENLLAKQVVENPNNLSGARPAGADTPATTPAANTNINTNANVNASPARPANANTNTRTANTAANTNANAKR
ncbi:MAG TPA: SurA N-terminal domain-containing protein [Pyrinomonadaceae bacterium]|jgi:parvulin-like peptidyl-prolyl isomerase